MKYEIIAFSRDGAACLKKLCLELGRKGEICEGFLPEKYMDSDYDQVTVKPLTVSVGEWTKEKFSESDCLIFVGAVGIAVRAIAPYIRDKYTDPAVVVVDDLANFAISLLSGHAGRSNEITRVVSRILGAEEVITTSSDVHDIYAVDEWAMALGLKITDHDLAKQIASFILDGGRPGFWEDPVCAGYCAFKSQAAGIPQRPDNCDEAAKTDFMICVTPHVKVPFEGKALRLIPRCITVGVGCKKGTASSVITGVIASDLQRENLDEASLLCLASVDLKAREPGLKSAAVSFSVPFTTFPSAFLDAIPGLFSESDFVRKVTGTGNVCERAAFAAAMRSDGRLPARLLSGKYTEDKVTAAIAIPVYSQSG